MMPRKSDIKGRFLDGKLTLVPGSARPPEAGYAVGLTHGILYRNGEDVGEVTAFEFDPYVLGWWVTWTSWRGSPMDREGR